MSSARSLGSFLAPRSGARIWNHRSIKLKNFPCPCSNSSRSQPWFERSDGQRRLLRRNLAVYAVGEAWTGALGTGRFDQDVLGHHDDHEDNADPNQIPRPFQLYADPVRSVSAGWGHTALVTEQGQWLMTGRPHDFSNLMRLKRHPTWFRNFLIRRTVASIHTEEQSADPKAAERRLGSVVSVLDPTEAVGRLLTWLSEIFVNDPTHDWNAAREQSFMLKLGEIALPDPLDQAVSVHCSAGLTACLTESGRLYMLGLNGFGQCGIGATSNNVWVPSLVTGLASEVEQLHPVVTQVALGLQHGCCLNQAGELFAWGKGERGQLGQGNVQKEAHTALPIKTAVMLDSTSTTVTKPLYETLGPVTQIASGMLHSAALTEDNRIVQWGKHILPPLKAPEVNDSQANRNRNLEKTSDARWPIFLMGWPSHRRVIKIACGSHHTSFLLEDGSVWATGISSDTKVPLHDPVLMIPAGVVEMPVRNFQAHMDRTTVIGADGRQVFQVNLWQDAQLREMALFCPAWIDRLLADDRTLRIREIHRSWVHSLAVTD